MQFLKSQSRLKEENNTRVYVYRENKWYQIVLEVLKIYQPLVRLTDKKRKDFTIDLKGQKGLYGINSGETDNVLERCTLPKLTLEKTGDMNEPMRRMGLNSSINYPQRKDQLQWLLC